MDNETIHWYHYALAIILLAALAVDWEATAAMWGL
jgi:hypothetical protein